MLTIKKLKEMKNGKIFAKGETIDSPEGCNMANTGKIMRWIAVRGSGYHDWTIYSQNPYYVDYGIWDWEKIRDLGDKITGEKNIKKLVSCDDDAYKLYRL